MRSGAHSGTGLWDSVRNSQKWGQIRKEEGGDKGKQKEAKQQKEKKKIH